RLRDRLDQLGADRSPPDKHPYIIVEKILGRGEVLSNDWGADGTTGYDFMNDVSALQHEEAGAELLSSLWHRLSLRAREFEVEEILARGEIAQGSFESALGRTVDAFCDLAEDTKFARDITRPAIRRALLLILQHLRVYRTYATGQDGSPPAGGQFDAAVADAKAVAGGGDTAALDFIGGSFHGAEMDASPDSREAIRRFNQLSAPVAAKAVEDTAFYRYGRLLSRNDVGFQPGILSVSIPEFHRRAHARAEHFPHTLLATATHDHKRGEDARARLAVLSEIPEEWAGVVERWFRTNARHRPGSVDPADEYQLYQTLVGAWPLNLKPGDSESLKRFGDRVLGWQEKALREAKLRSSWLDPNLECERDAQAFTRAILDPSCSSPFLRSLCEFVEKIAPAGALNGLVQTTLRCTVPGVPDCYQGAEFWDFSLVDPDNRRPVDYKPRVADLQASADTESLLAEWRGGGIKQALISALLQLRQRWPDVLAYGSYQPLALHGAQKDHVLAFARTCREQTIIVAVPVRVARVCLDQPLPDVNFWDNATIELPDALGDVHWERMFDNHYTDAGAQMRCSALFARFPVAVLVRT
ncbi:MAG TPA: malto-oligosyltrehalose synthase, partial [Rhizomicrobium sp.]|nr:malto-oligosyltrehalose synthase [Rhizomicrobium sp.]